jgi:hypothetical protein
MRNLTVRVPEEVYDAARTYASRYQTSISAVVADFLFALRHLARENRPVSPARRQFKKLTNPTGCTVPE